MKISLSAILNFSSRGADKVTKQTKEIKENLTAAQKQARQIDKAMNANVTRGSAGNYKDNGLSTTSYKRDRGITGSRGASGRNFAGMVDNDASNFVSAYAVLAANLFAVTAAFTALQKAAQTEQLAKGLELIGSRGGVALKNTANGLREVTDYAISFADSMKAVAQASAAGFKSDEIERLGKVARGASVALGRDMSDSMDRLIRGTIKLEPELLDELGIMTRLEEATRAYARANNKTVSSLTQVERRQAFLNAVLIEGESKFGDISEQIESNPYDKLSASVRDMGTAVLNTVNRALIPFVDLVAKIPQLAIFPLIFALKEAASKVLPDVGAGLNKARDRASLFGEKVVFLRKQLDDYTESMRYAGAMSASALDSAGISNSAVNRQGLADAFNPNNSEFELDRRAAIKQVQAEIVRLTKEDVVANAQKITTLTQVNNELLESEGTQRRILDIAQKQNAASAAQARSIQSQIRATSVLEARAQGRTGLGIAGAAIGSDFMALFSKAGNATDTLKNKFLTLSSSILLGVRTFSTALIGIMGGIGLLVSAIFLIIGLWDMFKSKSQKALDEARKKFDELTKSAKQTLEQVKLMQEPGKLQYGKSLDALTTSLQGLNSETEKYIRLLKTVEQESSKQKFNNYVSARDLTKQFTSGSSFGLTTRDSSAPLQAVASTEESINAAFSSKNFKDNKLGQILAAQVKTIKELNPEIAEYLMQSVKSKKTDLEKAEAIQQVSAALSAQQAKYSDLENALQSAKVAMSDLLPKDFDTDFTKINTSLQEFAKLTSDSLSNQTAQAEAIVRFGASELSILQAVNKAYNKNATDLQPLIENVEKINVLQQKWADLLDDPWKNGPNILKTMKEIADEVRKITSLIPLFNSAISEAQVTELAKREEQKEAAIVGYKTKILGINQQILSIESSISKERDAAVISAAKATGAQSTSLVDAILQQKVNRQSYDLLVKQNAEKRKALNLEQAAEEIGLQNKIDLLTREGSTEAEQLEGAKFQAKKDYLKFAYAAERDLLDMQEKAEYDKIANQQTLIAALSSEIALRRTALEHEKSLLDYTKQRAEVSKSISTLRLDMNERNAREAIRVSGNDVSPQQERDFQKARLIEEAKQLSVEKDFAIQEFKLKMEEFNMSMTANRALLVAAKAMAGGDATPEGRLIQGDIDRTDGRAGMIITAMEDLAIEQQIEIGLRQENNAQLQKTLDSMTAFSEANISLTARINAAKEDRAMLGQTAFMPSRAGEIFSSTVSDQGGLSNFTPEQLKTIQQTSMAIAETQIVTDALRNTFSALETGMTDAFTGLIDGTKDAKQAFADLALSVLSSIAKMIAEMITFKILSSFIPGFGVPAAAAGGIAAPNPAATFTGMGGAGAAGGIIPLAQGGITARGLQGVVKKPTYLVGEGRYNEAVVPLPNGRSIPVQMHGGTGGNNSVQVNVNVANNGNVQTETQGEDMGKLGSIIATAVQKELVAQKAPGGILNRYGAA
jgi:hypothetical protein